MNGWNRNGRGDRLKKNKIKKKAGGGLGDESVVQSVGACPASDWHSSSRQAFDWHPLSFACVAAEEGHVAPESAWHLVAHQSLCAW